MPSASRARPTTSPTSAPATRPAASAPRRHRTGRHLRPDQYLPHRSDAAHRRRRAPHLELDPKGTKTMGLSWQQGPLAPGAVGRFLVPGPLPERMLFAEPLRRRMRVRFGGGWIADSEDVVLLHEPGRYPVAYFPLAAVASGALQPSGHTTRHADLGPTAWYTVRAGEHSKQRAAWQHTELPDYASELKSRVAFAWRAMEAFYEEDERIVGHAADPYHREIGRAHV